VTLLLALSAAVVQAGPEWRQRSDGEQAAQRTLNQAQRLAPQRPQRALALLHQGLEAYADMAPIAARRYARALVALEARGAARRLLRRQLAALPRWSASAVAAVQRRGPEGLARRLFHDHWQRLGLVEDLRRLTGSDQPLPETP
jgi:hypothetical protein